MPAKFDLKYIDKKKSKKTPVVLHRAILGSLDRFMAYILEETKGVLPLWLAPIQINVIPVNNEYHLEYAKSLVSKLESLGFRVNLDSRDEKLGYKMREAQLKKYPYNLIIGQSEVDSNTLSYRLHGSSDTVTLEVDDFINKISEEIKDKKMAG